MNLMSSIDTKELPAPGLGGDELWYKDAIIYQLHVKAFADSNNDGIGDFAGLTEKLDYLQDLGVTDRLGTDRRRGLDVDRGRAGVGGERGHPGLGGRRGDHVPGHRRDPGLWLGVRVHQGLQQRREP